MYNNTYNQIEEIEKELDVYMEKVSKPLDVKNYNIDLNKLEEIVDSIDDLSIKEAIKKYEEIYTLLQIEEKEKIEFNYI